jgi:hypothetical protein
VFSAHDKFQLIRDNERLFFEEEIEIAVLKTFPETFFTARLLSSSARHSTRNRPDEKSDAVHANEADR